MSQIPRKHERNLGRVQQGVYNFPNLWITIHNGNLDL